MLPVLLAGSSLFAVPARAVTIPVPLAGGFVSEFAPEAVAQWSADTVVRYGTSLQLNLDSGVGPAAATAFANGQRDFVVSDQPFSPDDLDALRAGRCAGIALTDCIADVPVAADSVAFMFNLVDGAGNRITSLDLTRRAVCKIFTGAITSWDDPELVAGNAALAALHVGISTVVRADAASESLALSQFCIAVAPDVWSAFVSSQKAQGLAVNDSPEFNAGLPTTLWPTFHGAVPVAFNDGVADIITNPEVGPNSIGFVAGGFAQERNMPVANVENASGAFADPQAAAVTAGLAGALPAGDGTYAFNFASADPVAYQPDEVAWFVAPTAGFDPQKGRTLSLVLCWAVTTGQQSLIPLRDAPLTPDLQVAALDAIARIPGAPADCAGPPPATHAFLGSASVQKCARSRPRWEVQSGSTESPYVVPGAGVLTSWSTATTMPADVALAVWRPTATRNHYQLVAVASVQHVDNDSATFALDPPVPVRGGDLAGLYTAGAFCWTREKGRHNAVNTDHTGRALAAGTVDKLAGKATSRLLPVSVEFFADS